MNLLKEYIRLIIKEELEEDINIERLSPRMIGIYAFAQAINKLIYEGNALPGAIPIDIIDAGENIKSAPMSTGTERKFGLSFQFTGSSFKLYIDPTISGPSMSSGDETHDIIHAFTTNIAKAFGRRRQSVAKNAHWKLTPSRINRIVVDNKVKNQINDAFQKEFEFRLPEEAFTKPFNMTLDHYTQWFLKEFAEKMISAVNINHITIKGIAIDLWRAVAGSNFGPGLIGRKYYARYPDIERAFSFAFYNKRDYPFGQKENEKPVYKQSTEDEEELGNKMNDYIEIFVSRGAKIPDPEKKAEDILIAYSEAVGLTALAIKDFKHRFDTPEVKSAMIRLFELYNQLLERYQKAQELSNRKEFAGMFPGVKS